MKQKLFKYTLFRCLLLLAILNPTAVWAQFSIPKTPKENSYVYDYIDLLNQSQKKALQDKLYNYEDSTSTQIVIAIIDDLKGEDITMLGTKWGREWNVGRKDENNGIFILLKKDADGPGGQIDIATGYGIEYRMTDRMAKRVINQVILPKFRAQDYYGGLDAGTDALIDILSGEFEGEVWRKSDNTGLIIFLIFVGFFILIIVLSSKNRPPGGSSGSSFGDTIILTNWGRSTGSSSGSFGGGGFGSFGGGSFGGGGASGSW